MFYTRKSTYAVFQQSDRYFCPKYVRNEEQAWRSGESARISQMCPGFDSRTRRHMWVEFVVGSLLCSETFFSGFSGFPPESNILKFQFDPGMHGHF